MPPRAATPWQYMHSWRNSTAPFVIRLDGVTDDGEYRADVTDRELAAQENSLIVEHGEHSFVMYGRTAQEAIVLAVREVNNGTAARHFAEVRARYDADARMERETRERAAQAGITVRSS